MASDLIAKHEGCPAGMQEKPKIEYSKSYLNLYYLVIIKAFLQ